MSYSSKNIILNKFLIFYFYTYFYKIKNGKNNLVTFNSNKYLNLNFDFFIFSNNSINCVLKHIYTYSYMIFFFNQKFIELNKIKFFNKFFNKYYIFFFSCFRNYYDNEMVFYKHFNINFLESTFKNLKKFSKINESRFFKKNFFSKIHLFKLKNKNKNNIKYFNKNILFYFYFFKKYKNFNLLNQSNSLILKNNFWFFFSNVYTFKINRYFEKKEKKLIFSLNNKNNFKKLFFINFYKNNLFKDSFDYKFILNNNKNDYNDAIFFKTNFTNENFFNIFLNKKIIFVKKIKLVKLVTNYNFCKNIFNQKLIFKNDIKKQQLYKFVLKLLLIWSENSFFSIHKQKHINFCSNLNLFNLFNSFCINELDDNVDNKYLDKPVIYNNHYPLFIFKNNFLDFFNFKLKKCSKPGNLKFAQYYILGFFEYFFKKKVFLKSISNSNMYIHNFNKLSYLFDEFRFFQLRVVKGLHIIEILEIIWFSLQNKDVYLLINWLRKIMEKTHLKNHKKFLNLLKAIMIKYSHIFLESFRLKGFFFDIRGKVGVAGNSKKRHFFFRIGKINLSKKDSKLDYQQNIVNTSFGVLGVTMILSY